SFLEKNAELEAEMTNIHSRYVARIEKLEQENHSLRMKLDCSASTENSLSAEVDILRDQLKRAKESCTKSELALKKLETSLVEKQQAEADKRAEVELDLRSRMKALEEQLFESHKLNERLLAQDCSSMMSEEGGHTSMLVAREQELELLLKQVQSEVEALRMGKRALEAELVEADSRLRETLDLLTVERGATLKAEREAGELRAQLDALQLSQVDPRQRGNSLFSEVEDRRLKQERELLSLQTRYRALHEQESFLRGEVRRTRAQMAQIISAGGRQADARQVVLLRDSLARARLDIAQLTKALASQGSGATITSGAPSVPLSGLLEVERKKVEALERERLALFRAQSEFHVREDELLREAHKASLKAEALEARMLKLVAQKDDRSVLILIYISVGRKDATTHEQLGVVEEEPPVLRERIVMTQAFRPERVCTPSAKKLKTSYCEDQENIDKSRRSETQHDNATRDKVQCDEGPVEQGQCDRTQPGTVQLGRVEKAQRKPRVAFQDGTAEEKTTVDGNASLGTKRTLRRGSVVVPQQKVENPSTQVDVSQCKQQ
ncbi:unnamed protein product, partial [Ixodes hexagonus]